MKSTSAIKRRFNSSLLLLSDRLLTLTIVFEAIINSANVHQDCSLVISHVFSCTEDREPVEAALQYVCLYVYLYSSCRAYSSTHFHYLGLYLHADHDYSHSVRVRASLPSLFSQSSLTIYDGIQSILNEYGR